MNTTRSLRLLPEAALVWTGPVDHADWNYRPVLGWIQQLRFRMALRLLRGVPALRLLEIGYGSGVFMPALARQCRQLHGIDVHGRPEEVADQLESRGVRARLTSGSAESMPYADGFFDAAVAVSSLEFVEDIDAACREIRRVLTPTGCLVLVTPGSSPVADLGLRVLTGKTGSDYSDRRVRLVDAIDRHFRIDRKVSFPRYGGFLFRLYSAMRLFPKESAG